jgi:hypothetical protein
VRLLYALVLAIVSAFGTGIATVLIDPLFPEGLNLWLTQIIYSIECSVHCPDHETFVFLSPATANAINEGKAPGVDTHIAFCSRGLDGRRLRCVFRPTSRDSGYLGIDDEGHKDDRKFLVDGASDGTAVNLLLLRADLKSVGSYYLDHIGLRSEAMLGTGRGSFCDDMSSRDLRYGILVRV